MTAAATVNPKGAARWTRGHPWIFRSDVLTRPASAAGPVRVRDTRGSWLGWALWSPTSEISLRWLDSDADSRIDAAWWRRRLAASIRRRTSLRHQATAYRLVHAEADGCPSLICDRYGDYLVVQLLSAGIDGLRDEIAALLVDLTGADGVLARNDPRVRLKEGLPRETVLLAGAVPDAVEIEEHGVRYLAAPWTGQKTGAFLDQRENRQLVGQLARGTALDCFSYHGSFALHLATRADEVLAIDSSAAALHRAQVHAALNGVSNITFRDASAFDALRAFEREGRRFDTIVLDPPAFAKTRSALPGALRGYHEINVRALRVLEAGGLLFTASCSFHLSKARFLEMLADAAADSGRRIALRTITGQPLDHPEILTIPESGYIKGALLEAVE